MDAEMRGIVHKLYFLLGQEERINFLRNLILANRTCSEGRSFQAGRPQSIAGSKYQQTKIWTINEFLLFSIGRMYLP